MLGLADIEALIPHRSPILMLDRVIKCVPGDYGIGECDLDDDACFAGHFPGRPILPGALIVEACGQLLAVVCHANAPPPERGGTPPLDMLASIERFKFLSPALPGELLTIEARIGRRVGRLLQGRVMASVGRRMVAEGVLNVTSGEGK
jgi:3-hydroxyacyl-[acyl-carrier-protein] dehydratase